MVWDAGRGCACQARSVAANAVACAVVWWAWRAVAWWLDTATECECFNGYGRLLIVLAMLWFLGVFCFLCFVCVGGYFVKYYRARGSQSDLCSRMVCSCRNLSVECQGKRVATKAVAWREIPQMGRRRRPLLRLSLG